MPELDDAVRAQLDRVAHSTMFGNGNRVVVEGRGVGRVVPVDEAHSPWYAEPSASTDVFGPLRFPAHRTPGYDESRWRQQR